MSECVPPFIHTDDVRATRTIGVSAAAASAATMMATMMMMMTVSVSRARSYGREFLFRYMLNRTVGCKVRENATTDCSKNQLITPPPSDPCALRTIVLADQSERERAKRKTCYSLAFRRNRFVIFKLPINNRSERESLLSVFSFMLLLTLFVHACAPNFSS